MISCFSSLSFLLIAKTPPEKKRNRFAGFRTKQSMTSSEKWLLAQKEMIRYSEKMITPTAIMGIIFLLAELYALLKQHSEKFFVILIIIEAILFVLLLVNMYRHVNRCIENE